MITYERLKEVLRYEPDTGLFYWIVAKANCVKIGSRAGYLDKHRGYFKITVDGNDYGAHRLAWLYVYGEWPGVSVDHINGVKDDNRIVNLRNVTIGVNNQNQRRARKDNRLGILGVTPIRGKFQATIEIDGKSKYLGIYSTTDEAYKAYIEAKRKYHEGNTL